MSKNNSTYFVNLHPKKKIVKKQKNLIWKKTFETDTTDTVDTDSIDMADINDFYCGRCCICFENCSQNSQVCRVNCLFR